MSNKKIFLGYQTKQFISLFELIDPTFLESYDPIITTSEGLCTEEEQIEALKTCEVFVGFNPVRTRHLENAPNLKLVSAMTMGLDKIDIEECSKRGVYVANSPFHGIESTSDHAITLILAANKQIYKSMKYIHDGKWLKPNFQICVGNDLRQQTVGMVGFGRIGKRVADKLHHGWGMNVLYHCRSDKNLENYEYVADLNELFSRCKIISVNLPYTKHTHHYIDKEQFDKIKLDRFGMGMIFVNTSRGPIVNESALVEALNEKKVRVAGLDVFENEPKIHPDLMSNENCILTSHIGGQTMESWFKMAKSIVDNVKSFYENGKPVHAVNELD
ncbi:glyoxylate reductase 1 [Anaeramoeba flamelloides]|uniref:Glyoxylate reductase n=1 Tax=Anaeramoeba flamelloides TaxID=1746091 RepID=A0AAV7YNQ2_9EUKA|nr:glyoxylate reductase [Anaeramoeba flamelloides]KAJ6228752.1 glyoxylate reductase 1 [Anaeramoeba flamelloides]